MRRILLTCVCLVAFTAPAAVAQPLADRLPAGTLVYSGWSPSSAPAVQQTRAARMLADERIVQPWRAVLQSASLSLPGDLAAGGSKVSEHFPKLLVEAAKCEGCFALLDVGVDKNHLSPRAVLVLNLGERRKAFEEHFRPIQAVIADRLGARVQMMKLENSWLWVKTARDRSEYAWGFLGDSFVFYVGEGADTFLPTLAAPRAKSLAGEPAFADSLAKLPGGAEALLTTYVNARRFQELVHALVKQANNDDLRALDLAWPKLVGQLGLDNAVALVERTTVADGRFLTRSLLRTDGAPHGLLAAVVRGPVDDAVLKLVPPDAMFAVALRLDLAKSYEQLKAGIIAVTGDDGRKAFGDVEDAAAGFGVPVANVLGPLGDQWLCYEAASTGAFFLTGLTVVVDVKDEARLSRTLAALKALLKGQAGGADGAPVVLTYNADDVAIQYLQPGGGFNFVLPAWAVAGKRLYVGLYPQVVEDAIRQSKAERSLLDNPEFIAARNQVGAGGPLLYLSNPEFIKSLYPVVLPLVSALREVGIFNDNGGDPNALTADLLPSLQRLLGYVGTDAVGMRLTEDGVLRTTSSANPLLTPLTLIDSVPLWVVAALPAMATSAETADRAKSAENLRTIGRALQLYVVDHNGAFPPDLVTLTAGNDGVDKDVLRSPFGPEAAKQPPDDYRYLVAGAKSQVPPDVVTAYDHAAFEKDEGANVLYGDGHVEWLDRDGVTAALEKTGKWRQELKR